MNDNQDIERLLRLAGPREAVSSDRMLRVKSAVHAEWQEQTRTRSRQRAIGWSLGALAAAAMLVVGLRVAVRQDVTPMAPGAVVATLEASGETLRSGSVIETTAGFSSIRLTSGVVVRVDRDTRVRVMSDSAVTLDHGGVYVNSDVTSPSTSLEIHTKFGVARDIGTRFEVRVGDSSLRVRVRDGLVQLQHNRQSHEAKPGEELTLDASGRVMRRHVPVYGPEWDWVVALARPFEIEGRSLREFLDWISGENGWQLKFVAADIEEKSSTTILHGSIQGLTPVQALAAVLPASGVPYELDKGILFIGRAPGGSQD